MAVLHSLDIHMDTLDEKNREAMLMHNFAVFFSGLPTGRLSFFLRENGS